MQRADHLSRRIPLSVIEKQQQRGGHGPRGAVEPRKKEMSKKQKLYMLAYQLLVTLGCFSGQKCVTRRKASCRQMKTLTHTSRHFRFSDSSVTRRSSLPKIVACRKIPANGYVTSGLHSTYFQYLAEITTDSAQVYVVPWFPS